MLEEADEVTVADGGYCGTVLYLTPDDSLTLSDRRASSNVRACHETINGRLKTFRALAKNFTTIVPNTKIFSVAVVTVKLMME